MAYFEIIEESTTWTCPKTADYKIICVASGANYVSSAAVNNSTSFGSYLTASGLLNNMSINDNYIAQMGYSINNSHYGEYGIRTKVMCTTDVIYPTANMISGYGHGGAASYSSTNMSYSAGKMMMKITSLTAGETVACTVGAAVAASATNYNNSLSSGAGVIIIQEV